MTDKKILEIEIFSGMIGWLKGSFIRPRQVYKHIQKTLIRLDSFGNIFRKSYQTASIYVQNM